MLNNIKSSNNMTLLVTVCSKETGQTAFKSWCITDY